MPQSLANSRNSRLLKGILSLIISSGIPCCETYALGVCYDPLSGFVGQMSKLGIFRITVHKNKIVLSVS